MILHTWYLYIRMPWWCTFTCGASNHLSVVHQPSECGGSTIWVWSINHLSVAHKPSECGTSTIWVWHINHLRVVRLILLFASPFDFSLTGTQPLRPINIATEGLLGTRYIDIRCILHIIICKPIWFLTDGAPQPLQPDQPLTLLTEMLLPNFFGSDGCRIRLFASPFDLSHWRGSTIATDWHNNWGAPQYIDIRCVLHIIRAKRVSNWYISKKKSARVPVCRVFD